MKPFSLGIAVMLLAAVTVAQGQINPVEPVTKLLASASQSPIILLSGKPEKPTPPPCLAQYSDNFDSASVWWDWGNVFIHTDTTGGTIHEVNNGTLVLQNARLNFLPTESSNYVITAKICITALLDTAQEGHGSILFRRTELPPGQNIPGTYGNSATYTLFEAPKMFGGVLYLGKGGYFNNDTTWDNYALALREYDFSYGDHINPNHPSPWYTLRIEMAGSSMKGYVDNVLLVQAKDMLLPTGTIALASWNATVLFDDFSVCFK